MASSSGNAGGGRIAWLQGWALRRAPRLTATLSYWVLMGRQARALKRAGGDERSPRELLQGAEDGTVAGIDGVLPIDPRHRLGSIVPVQMREELLTMLERVRELAPARLCEIGASGGGTLYMLTRVAPPDALIVSLDLEIPPHTARARSRMARRDQRLLSIEADSHDPSTRDQVVAALGGQPLDFLFIDGDHSFQGVKADFELYSPLVRAGGLIALHDIQPDRRSEVSTSSAISGEVPRFWAELKRSHRTEELIASPDQEGYGIGLVFP